MTRRGDGFQSAELHCKAMKGWGLLIVLRSDQPVAGVEGHTSGRWEKLEAWVASRGIGQLRVSV